MTTPANYVVIENTPGYLPEDDDPPTFDNYSQALTYLAEKHKELREDADRDLSITPIFDGQFVYYDRYKTRDIGRIVKIEPIEAE
jgi:hypothetical protein